MNNNKQVYDLQKTRAYDGFLKMDVYNFAHEKFDGSQTETITREVLERGQSVAVLLYDQKTDKVLVIRQFLIGAHIAGVDNCPIQVVAGMVDGNQTPEEAAVRECFEEAGVAPDSLVKGPVFLPSPGGTSELIHTYVGMVDLEGAGGRFGLETEHEDIEAVLMNAGDVIKLLDDGFIQAGPAVVILSFFARKHEEMKTMNITKQN